MFLRAQHILAGLFAPSMMMRVASVGLKLNFPCFITRSWRCGVCGGKVVVRIR